MEIKVQSIAIDNKSEKQVLLQMRKAINFQFEYILKHENVITRFSSEIKGAITPLVALDKIKAANLLPETYSNYHLILDLSETSVYVVKIKNGLIKNIRIHIKDSYTTEHLKGERIVVDEALADTFPNATVFPTLTKQDIEQSPHVFVDKNVALSKLRKPLATALVGIICAFMVGNWFLTEEAPQKVTETPKKVVKRLRIDPYYEYKSNIKNRYVYEEISDALIAATIMNQKLPTGWIIEEIIADKNGVSAPFVNDGGRTGVLKYFREQSSYKEHITIDGKTAQFKFKPNAEQWFSWTQKTEEFEPIRDDFMDHMLLLGAKLRSKQKQKQSNFQFQTWEVTFEQAPIAYLDMFNTLMGEAPIFIDQVRVRPNFVKSERRANINFEVTIIGR